jgi:heme oxygenase (mycobilin-producing)
MATVRINHFHATPGQEASLGEFLQSVMTTIRGAAGCQGVELLLDKENAARLVIVERWDNVASHQAAARLIPPSKLAEVGPLLAEPPKGQYYEIV